MIRKELGVFLVVGSLTVLIDYLSYRSLVWTALLDANLAKGAGFLVGTFFAYYANRFWTFSARKHAVSSAWRFATLYFLTLMINVGVNAFALQALPSRSYPVQVAFVVATGLSAALNFLGMKYLVFSGKR